MQITGLPQSGAFTGTDVLAIEINGVTYKLDGATLATAITSIGSLVTGVKGNNEDTYRTGNVNITPANVGALAPSDVVNNLTSTSTTQPLSAAQGKALKEAIAQSTANVVWEADKNSSYYGIIDPNNYTTNGFYHVGINIDGNDRYGILLVFVGNVGHFQQLFLSTYGSYVRSKNTTVSTWTAWRTLG